MFAAANKVSDSVAVAMLEEAGCLIGDYRRDTMLQNRRMRMLEPWQAAQTLWDEASRGGRLIVSPDAQRLLGNMHVSVESRMSWSTQGPGRLAGYIDSSRVEKLLYSQAKGHSTRINRQDSRLPATMNDAIVVPFYDVPGRISSIAFLHSPNRNAKWSEFVRPIAYGSVSSPWEEGGLAIHPYTLETPGDGTLLLTSDVATYLKMQTKHFTQSAKPLQLACYHNNVLKTSVWQSVASRDLVIWCAGVIHPDDMWLAMQLNAKITTYGPKVDDLSTVCRRIDPAIVHERCISNAKSWPEMMAKLVNKMDTEELTDWLTHMSLNPEAQSQVLNVCPPSLKDKLNKAFGSAICTKVIEVSDGFVEQRTNGWFFTKMGKNPELVTNAPFWIRYAVNQTSANKVEQLYGVETTLAGQSISFEIPVTRFQRDPFKYVQEALIAKGVGVPAVSAPWKSKVLHISLQMHQPTVLRRSSVAGYSKQDRCFHLPRIVIDASGAIQVSSVGKVAGMPGRPISAGRVFNEQIEMFLSLPSAPVYLALYSSMLTQILTPAADLATPQLLFRAKTLLKPISQISHIIGTPISSDQSYKAVAKTVRRHAWPVVFGVPVRLASAVRSQVLRTLTNLPVCTPVTMEDQLYGELNGSAITVDSPATVELIDSERLRFLQTVTGHLLSYFRQQMLSEKLHAPLNPAIGTLGIFEDWLRSRGVSRNQFPPARELMHGGVSASSAIPRALGMLVTAGRLKQIVLPSRDDLAAGVNENRSAAIFRLKDAGEVFVTRNTLQESLTAGGAPKLDLGELSARLSEEGHRIRVEMHNGTFGYTLSEASLDWHLNRMRASRRRLRVLTA